MAHLLGTKYCLNSLFLDIKDIQETVGDVTSRVGQVKYQSWKFPDKMSIDVDVEELLEKCKYDENDEEQNQVAHVMLYDLLIDRLLFLLQTFTHFNEILLSTGDTAEPTKNVKSPNSGLRSMSAGLTAKKCWSRITQIAATLQQLAKAIQKNKQKSQVSKNSDEQLASIESSLSRLDSAKRDSPASEVQVSSKSPTISEDVVNRACQTAETSYISCESCSRAQGCLHDVGKFIVKLCKSQGLPTSLEDYIAKQCDSSLFSIAELSRWKNIQMKDLSRVDRHMINLMKQINPLKKELSDLKLKDEKHDDEMKRLEVMADNKHSQLVSEQKRQELKYKEAEKLLARKLSDVNSENTKLQEHISALQIQLSDMKDELLQKHRTIIATENEKSQLKEEAVEGKQYKEDLLKLRSEVSSLSRKLKSSEEKLQSTCIQLEKESNRNRTLQSHEEALQEKQHSILKRFEELNEECEELREQLALAEDDKEELEECLKREKESSAQNIRTLESDKSNSDIIIQEKEGMERRIADLQTNVSDLERQLEEAVERERLLVSYPDLHKSQSVTLLESTGNVVMDMKRQIQANETRINLLEKENLHLRKMLSKISPDVSNHDENPHQYDDFPKTQSVQLWKSSSSGYQRRDDDSCISDSGTSYMSGLSSREKPTRLHSSCSKQSVDKSSHNYTKRNNSAIDTYKKAQENQISPTRHSFSVGPGKRRTNTPVSSRPSSGRSALLKPWT